MSQLPRQSRRRGAVLATVATLVASIAALVPSESHAATAPANDDFQNAQVLTGLPAYTTGSNVGATIQPGESMPEGQQPAATVWYSWTAPSTGPVQIDTLDSPDIDTVIAVYTLAGKTLVPAALDDDYSGASHYRSLDTIYASAGTTYYIQLGGYDDTQRWLFSLKITPMTTGLTGTVTRAGAPVAGACVTLVGGLSGSHGITDSAGRYALTGDPGTSYSLAVNNCLGTTDIQPASLGGMLAITSGAITSASTVDTAPGSSVSGRVINQYGAAVTDGCATALRTSPATPVVKVSANVDTTAHYVIRGLPDGTYTVKATQCGADFYTTTPAPGTYIVSGGSSAAVPDIQVTEDGQIAGRLMAGNTPVNPGCAEVFNGATSLGNTSSDTGTTLAVGGYTFNAPPGAYQVSFTNAACGGSPTNTQWFDNASTQAGAANVTVSAGRVVLGVNANFQSGGVTYPAPTSNTDSTPFVSPVCTSDRAAAAAAASAAGAANAALAAAQATVARAAALVKQLGKQIKKAKKHGKSTTKLTKRLKKARKALAADTRAAATAANAAAAATGAAATAAAAVNGAC